MCSNIYTEIYMSLNTCVLLIIICSASYYFIQSMIKLKKIIDEIKEKMHLLRNFHNEKKDYIIMEKYIKSLELRIVQLEKNKTH